MPTPPQFGDEDYGDALVRHSPRGPVWRSDPLSIFVRSLHALAPVYSRSTGAAAALVTDINPTTTSSLLPEWEASLGLPDECTPPNPTLLQRQAAVRAKWGARGTLSVGYYIHLAASLGFTITVQEFKPGNPSNPDYYPVDDPAWSYTWQITVVAPALQTLYFSADVSVADDPLETWVGADELVCRIRKTKPAETVVFFVLPS